MSNLYTKNELYHYGVKGMKWGVRRYRNKDGTWTEKGKRRYENITSHEDNARAGTGSKYHQKKTMAKYESLKNEAQKQADRNRQKALDDYRKYVDDYYKTHENTQVHYEHDYDHTKKGKRLINAFVNSSEVRMKAYEGAEWYEKYAKEMERAYNKDNRQMFRQDRNKNAGRAFVKSLLG